MKIKKSNYLKVISLNSKDITLPSNYELNRALCYVKGLNIFKCNLILLVSNLPARVIVTKLTNQNIKSLKIGLNRLDLALEKDLTKNNKKFKK